jgi:hypothetical protein
MEDDKQEVTTETTKYCVLKELDLGDTDISDEGISHSLVSNFVEIKS